MKTKATVTILALAMAMAGYSLRATEHDQKKAAEKQMELMSAGSRHLEPLGQIVKASDVLGSDAKDLQGEKLGKVEELAVDLASGRIVQVILSSGSFVGIGGKHYTVTPQSLRYNATEKVVHLDATKSKLESSPTYDYEKWDDYSQSNRVTQVYRHFDQRPYFMAVHDGKRTARPVSPLGYVAKAGKVIGTTVKNNQDETLGTVNELLINLERGRIAQVIVSSGGFLGIGDELSAMPPTAFRYDNSRKFLHLDATKDDLTRAPHFKNSQWPDFNDPTYAESVYRAYRVEPYFDVDVAADNTGRNVRDRDGASLTPLDQGNSAADVDTTKSIRRQLLAQDHLSVNARNVKIITIDGAVTLRGPVNSEEEKRAVATIASRVVSANRVNNQLEVKLTNN